MLASKNKRLGHELTARAGRNGLAVTRVSQYVLIVSECFLIVYLLTIVFLIVFLVDTHSHPNFIIAPNSPN